MAQPINLPFGLWTRVIRGSTRSVIFARWHQCALMGGHIAATWRIRLNHWSAVAMHLMSNYLDHSLTMPTYTVAQIAERFELNTVLWAFHIIQPSNYFYSERIDQSDIITVNNFSLQYLRQQDRHQTCKHLLYIYQRLSFCRASKK